MKFTINLKQMYHSLRLTAKEYSPEALVFLGVCGTTIGTVMACRATMKLKPVLEQHEEAITKIHDNHQEDTEVKEEKQELAQAYLHTGTELVKLYAPSVTISLLSVTGILTGNRILRQRNISLAAAYAALDSGFKIYRNRVVQQFGEDVDHALRFGTETQTIEETVTDENGNETVVKKEVEVMPASGPSDYARYFAYGDARAAEANFDYNEFFLHGQQEVANRILRADGMMFLNDVYKMLGIEPSVAGQTVGWVYDKHSEDHGDNHIDFRIQEVYRTVQGPNGAYQEKVLMIDPNVDGPILNHAIQQSLLTK